MTSDAHHLLADVQQLAIEINILRPKAECLAYIEEVWTDMRPLSLRKQMAATEKKVP